jgi:hypothetical protein
MKQALAVFALGVLAIIPKAFGGSQLEAAQLQCDAAKLRLIASNLTTERSTASAAIPVASAAMSAATLAEAAAQKASATPKDENEWTGDQIQIQSNLEGLKKAGDSSGQKYYAPAFVRFDVSKDENDTISLTSRGNYIYTKNQDAKPVVVYKAMGHNFYGNIAELSGDNEITNVEIGNVAAQNIKLIEPNTSYEIQKSAIENIVYKKYGWTYGVLVVPYKFQTHDKSINFAPSYQGYVGYKTDKNGTAEGPFVSLGLTTADIPTGDGTSISKQGLSYGLGWLFEIKKGSGFQLVALAGRDRISSGYQYDGKVWFSVTLGFSLDPVAQK